MPEPEDPTPSGLHLPASDPAAPTVEALRALAGRGPVEPSAELAAFFDDPAGQGLGTTPHPRSDRVTVVRLPFRRAGRAAVAVGAALALAALGGVAVAATGGSDDREPAQVQQDDPSDTTTTTEASETETDTAATEGAEDTEGDDQDGDAQGEDASDDAGTATHTPNATAYANHHDGVGSDDEHADVNGGGSVDHRAEHSPSAHPSKGGGGDDADEGGDDQRDDQGDEADDEGDDAGQQAPASQRGGGSKSH